MKRAALTLATLACIVQSVPIATAQETIRIGVLQSYSGMTGLNGQQTDAAIKLFIQQKGDTVGGKKVEFVRRDTTGPNPEIAKRLVQEAVTRDKVQILIGPDYTPNVIASASIITEAKVPSFGFAATTGIIGERSPYLIRTFFAIPQLCRPMAPYAIKNNLKRIFVVVADFAPGHECEKVFGTAFIQAQGTILGNLRIPLKNPEFAGYMQRIRDAKPEALFVFMPIGEMSIGIARAFNESGLKAAGIKMLATGDITDETYIDAIGDSAIGIVTTGIYSSIHDSPVNKKFAADYVAVNGKSPRVGWISIAAWDAMQLIYDGLAAQAGSKFDPDKFMAHVRGRTIESPRGPITIDKANNDIIQDVYIRRVEKIDGVLQNVEIESFRAEATK